MVQRLNFIRNPIKLNANLVYIIFEWDKNSILKYGPYYACSSAFDRPEDAHKGHWCEVCDNEMGYDHYLKNLEKHKCIYYFF